MMGLFSNNPATAAKEAWGLVMSGRSIKLAVIGAMMAGTMVAEAQSQVHKEYRFNVGPKAGVAVNNPYGSISVLPSSSSVVIVRATLFSDKVEVDNTQTGNRVEIQSHLLSGADADSGRVDYEVFVPADASILLHSSTGPLHAAKLHGDVTMEGTTGLVEVSDLSDAHVHVKTLDGPVSISNVHDGHVEVDSLSGAVTLRSVDGPLVQVISTSGNITYFGDFGNSGEYRLTSHSGNIEATVPETTSADVSARSVRGEVTDDLPLQPKTHTWYSMEKGRAFAGTIGRVAVSSTVVLRSFSGKIHLKKRQDAKQQ